MNIKNMSIVAVAACLGLTGAFGAPLTKEECAQKKTGVWATNLRDENGQQYAACISRDTCGGQNDRYRLDRLCVTTFDHTQVETMSEAHNLADLYAQYVLGWPTGCDSFIDYNVNNTFGDDYFGCLSNDNKYVSFQFDDTNDHDRNREDEEYTYSLCLALGGNIEADPISRQGGNAHTTGKFICHGITQHACEMLPKFTKTSVGTPKYNSEQGTCVYTIYPHRVGAGAIRFENPNEYFD